MYHLDFYNSFLHRSYHLQTAQWYFIQKNKLWLSKKLSSTNMFSFPYGPELHLNKLIKWVKVDNKCPGLYSICSWSRTYNSSPHSICWLLKCAEKDKTKCFSSVIDQRRVIFLRIKFRHPCKKFTK